MMLSTCTGSTTQIDGSVRLCPMCPAKLGPLHALVQQTKCIYSDQTLDLTPVTSGLGGA